VSPKTAQERHRDRYARGMRSSVFGLGINLVLAMGKLAGGILGSSNALIADAVESLGDVFGSVIVWRGLQIASRPPDHDHPYGHGKAEPLAAALVSVILIGAAIGIAIECAHEIVTPQHGPAPFTLAVLFGVIVVKETMFRWVLHVGKDTGSQVVHTDAWHHRSDAITSAAAAVGISVALIGGKGYEAADDWAALFASGIIMLTGLRLLRPAVEELMDTSLVPGLVEETTSVAESYPGVHRVEKLLIRKMGIYFIADMHLEVDPTMTVFDGHEIAHGVKDTVRERLPQIIELTIHIEPTRPGAPAAAATRGEAAAAGTPPTP